MKRKQWAICFFSLVVLLTILSVLYFPSADLSAANLGTNLGFNNPYNNIPGRFWQGQPHKSANGWTHFYIDANTFPGSGDASKLRWMSSAQFAAAFGGIDYHIEGDQAQNLWSAYEFDGGLYQQISGVTPGVDYAFDIAIVTFWRGPGAPIVDGKMVRQVGIDPFGGTDPTSSSIVWSDPNATDNTWVYMDVAARAQASTITIFAKVQAPENESVGHTDLDMIYFDAAHFDLAPTTTLNATNSGTIVNATWSGSPAAGWSLKGFEAQYKDDADGTWITLQNKSNSGTQASFTGQAGHTYTVRTRSWQTKSESYESDIDVPGVWVEKSVTVGNAVVGRVQNHVGIRLGGVTVAIDGTAISTTSGSDGSYSLATSGPGTFRVVAGNSGSLQAPPATSVAVAANGVAELDLTLRPTGAEQAMTNNDFETDLSGWSVDSGGAATASTNEPHTGQRSLRITAPVVVSQTTTVSNLVNPALSFWYKSEAPLLVEFLGASAQTVTLQPASDWTFFSAIRSGGAYSGPIGVRFSNSGSSGTNIFIDEVSIGTGPYQVLLPVILKQ